MRLALPLLAAAGLALTACQPVDTSIRLEVTDAWCRPTPNGVDVGACYLTATSSTANRITGAASPRAGSVMLHTTTAHGDMMKMEEAEGGVAMLKDQPTRFAPGGDHLMLMALPEPLVAGQRVPITLTFERGGDLEIQAVVSETGPAA